MKCHMTKVLICDPPSGWMYGFPLPIPDSAMVSDETFVSWLKECGYPDKLIPSALRYSRYYEKET